MNDTRKMSNELTIFSVGKMVCGLLIDEVQEINKHIEITKVYTAPDYVRGIINLRGQITTVIDMRIKFGFDFKEINKDMRILIVKSKDEFIGLLVDGIDDIMTGKLSNIEPPPSNIRGVTGDFFTGILKTESELIAILDKDKLMTIDTGNVQ